MNRTSSSHVLDSVIVRRNRIVWGPIFRVASFLAALFLGSGAVGLASPARALDVTPWDRVLRAHAHGGGVDYAALKADDAAMDDLRRFVTAVGQMEESEGLGPWLDAYNALAVHAVVRRYPIDSVRDVPGFFDRQTFLVAGRQRTLDEIENRIIRPRFRDARIHFAINCGARSCPALQGRALSRGDLDATLDRLTRAALRNPRHVRVRDGALYVTRLFEWFRDDFARDGGSVVSWIRRHRQDLPAEAGADDELRYLPYDWRLNDRPR